MEDAALTFLSIIAVAALYGMVMLISAIVNDEDEESHE